LGCCRIRDREVKIMPTNRAKRTRIRTQAAVEPAKVYYLTYGTLEGAPPHNEFIMFDIDRPGHLSFYETWGKVREEVMAAWVKEHPGTRPYGWWKYDAPLEQVKRWEGQECPQRERLGGTGTPRHEVLGWGPHFEKGIPTGWVTKFDEEYYNGRRKDIHGNPIGTQYQEGHFKGVAIDPDDPPVFESEAAYLQRLGLLTEWEKRYLDKHPELLKPEAVRNDDE
jgi:hypothetical protein